MSEKSYDALARFYNKYWTASTPELFWKVLSDFFLPSLPDEANILDVCCGTGQVCALLSDDGYKVTGLDLSQGMLDIARINAPKASFIKADACAFSLDEPADAAVSLFDSVNHFMTIEQLEACFGAVKRALKPDAPFIFDVNDSSVFTDVWENGFSAVEDDNICILRPSFRASTLVATYHIVMMDREEQGTWRRTDVDVYEKYYSPQEIVAALTKAGFSNMQMLDGEDDLGITQFRGRLFFIAS
jgi:SAM-dependent methyltransferase